MILGPWQVYNPGKDYNGVIFIQAKGMDWYKYRETIKTKYLVVFGQDGGIVNVYEDFSHAFPGNFYSMEVDEIPEDFDRNKYRFGPEGFYEYTPTPEEIVAKNRRIQDGGCKRVAEEINTLTMLKTVGVISDEETERLDRLIAFVKAVRAVDLNNPDWPDLPS